METHRLCAYNQTRECFLGLEVASVDISFAELKTLLGKLALKSGEGLWMTPFRGIPETNMRSPLDLIYLDEDCRVIEVVESFPTFHVTPSSPQAVSVLALPTHSIYSSQTQPGDQLVLCMDEEMQQRLVRFFNNSSSSGNDAPSPVLLRGKPQWNANASGAAAEAVSIEERPSNERSRLFQIYDEAPVASEPEEASPQKGWLERWFVDPRKSQDLRKAPRDSFAGLSAYYWTGAAPKAHNVKDISATGMYVVTEDRWYPGTLILITLQDLDDSQDSISIHSRSVRWGSDGVGLQFIPQDGPEARKGLNTLVHGADTRDLDQFLMRLKREAI